MVPSEAVLEGRVVLVTRQRDRAASLVSSLENLGARVDARAAIAFEGPRDSGAADAAAANLDRYHWIVFTSPTGVRFFNDNAHRSEAGTRGVRIVAIGPATARALLQAGLRADVTAVESHSQGLADELRARVHPGERVLIVRPETAPETVPDAVRRAGAVVETVAFYRTVASPDAEAMARCVCAAECDIVVLTSPSNLRFMVEAADAEGLDLIRALAVVRRVAIGPTTADALSEVGLAAHATASSPDDDGLVNAIVDAIGC